MNNRQRFDVNLPAHSEDGGKHGSSGLQGAQMVNASLTGFRLVFKHDQVSLGKKGTVGIALAIPGQGMVKVRARIVWIHFGLKTAGFEITEGHDAYESYIESLEQAA